MNDLFSTRVRAAAVAAWWTVLAAAILATITYIAYIAIVCRRPDWFMKIIGPGVSWDDLQRVYLWAIAGLKFVMWLMALAALWLTLWARELRKRGS
ncbi:MAG: hypothetical protein FWD61_17360 [Phycisphaerales bacterium]|nr:hypothetical protein [Phycisphaerales bacterium]